MRLAFKEAALQEQSGWNAQLERKLAEAVLPKDMESKVSRRRVPLHGPQLSPYQNAQKDCFDLFGDLGF